MIAFLIFTPSNYCLFNKMTNRINKIIVSFYVRADFISFKIVKLLLI